MELDSDAVPLFEGNFICHDWGRCFGYACGGLRFSVVERTVTWIAVEFLEGCGLRRWAGHISLSDCRTGAICSEA